MRTYANKIVDLYPTIKSGKKYIEIEDVTSFSLPEVSFGEGELDGAGIIGKVNIPDPYSLEAMEASITAKGFSDGVLVAITPSGIDLRLNWAVDNVNGKNATSYTSYTATIKGRPKNIPGGDIKKGEGMEETVNIAVGYYKLVKDGRVIHEIDPLNGKLTINGKNYADAINKALNK